VDNAVIELDANEPPIADGSSRDFTAVIKAPRLKETAGEEGIHHADGTDRAAFGRHADDGFSGREFQDHVHEHGQAERFTQFYSTEITPKTWEKEL